MHVYRHGTTILCNAEQERTSGNWAGYLSVKFSQLVVSHQSIIRYDVVNIDRIEMSSILSSYHKEFFRVSEYQR